MQHLDLYFSFFLFFVLGALVNALVRMAIDYREHKQRQRDDRLDRIETSLHEMRIEMLERNG